MIIMKFIVFPITLCLIWKLKWSITERILLTITFFLLDCFIIPKWLNSPTNILTEIISNIKILLIIVAVLGLILYISKKNKNYEQISEQEIEKLKLQAQQPQSISKLKTEYVATIKNLVLGVFLVLFLFGIFLNSAEFYNPRFPKKESFVEGYLKKGARWTDEYNDVWHMNKLAQTGRVHGNSEPVRVEIWNDMPDKDIIVMIYFLEGRYAGRWGYTIKPYTTTENVRSE